MEFQLHPDSSRGAVRSVQWGRRGELWATAAAGVAAALVVSLWITVPLLAGRAVRARTQSDSRSDLVSARRSWRAGGAGRRGAGPRARGGRSVEPHRVSLRRARRKLAARPESGDGLLAGDAPRGSRAEASGTWPVSNAGGRCSRPRRPRTAARRPHALAAPGP
jgi:hypothetical protein